MHYPDFFEKIPTFELIDPLSKLLATFEEGRLEISYLDVVKGSGHSCASVAGAYLITYHALKALYPGKCPVRGDISVQFSSSLDEGVTGVLANVITYITGAAGTSGFKGINGKFARHALMTFEQPVPFIRFSRTDNGKSVDLFYDPEIVPPDHEQTRLMKLVMLGQASDVQKEIFGKLWQERVKRILLDNFEDEKLIRVEEV